MIRLPGKFCTVRNREGTDQHHPWMYQEKQQTCKHSVRSMAGWSMLLWLSPCPLVAMGIRTYMKIQKCTVFERKKTNKTNNKATQAEWAGWSSGCSYTELHLPSFYAAALFSSLPHFCEVLLKRTCGISHNGFTEPQDRVTTWEPLQLLDAC